MWTPVGDRKWDGRGRCSLTEPQVYECRWAHSWDGYMRVLETQVLADTDLRMAFLPDLLLWSDAKLHVQKHLVNSWKGSGWHTAHYCPEPTLNQIWAHRLGFGAVGCKCVVFPSMVYTEAPVLMGDTIFLPRNSDLDREVLHSHSQDGGVGRELEDKRSAFSSSAFRLCGSGEVTSPLWVCRPHWVVVSIKWVHGCGDLFVNSKMW